jgi:uncharacterized protein YhhL (DUF1145 family)
MLKKVENIAILISMIFLMYMSVTEMFIRNSTSKTDKILSSIAFFIIGILILKRFWKKGHDRNKVS